MRWSVFSLVAAVAAAPANQFMFNNQLPPVVRYGEPYSYTFNVNTFSSPESITYSAPDLPSWLKFDASTRTLSGTAPASDKANGDQQFNFTLQAADSTGTTVAPCVLQLSADVAPEVQPASRLQQVLEGAGPIANNLSLVLNPGQDFEIQFPADYFTSDGRPIVGHYSVTEDHAPLPIWLKFDGAAGKYWGTAPTPNSGIAQAESFNVLYIVSTYDGFASASSEFNILVGAHSFTTNLTTDPVNVTVGEFFNYEVPLSQISLNGESPTRANISRIEVQIPADHAWLAYNDGNSSIFGTPPANANNQTVDIPIQVADVFNDTVSFSVRVTVQEKSNQTVFSSSSWRPANVTGGEFFEYSIADYVLNKNAQVSMDAHSDTWLQYHADNFTVNGLPPKDFSGTIVDFSAKFPGSGQAEIAGSRLDATAGDKATLTLLSAQANKPTPSRSVLATASSAPSATASAATSSAPAAAKPQNKHKSNKTVAIACGVAIPLALLAILAVLLLCCCRRRRQRQRDRAGAAAGTPADHEKGTPGGGSAASPHGAGLSPGDVSGPIAPATGVLMAPVFRASPDTSSDGTFVATPEMKKDDPTDWTTPHRVSAYNFMRMDDEDVSDAESTAGAGAGAGAGAAEVAAGTGAGAAAGAAVGAGTAVAGATPRDPQDGPVPVAPPRAAAHSLHGSPASLAGAVAAAPARNVDLSKIHQRTIRNATPLAAGGGAGATARAARETEQYSNVPRESWRHTNLTDRRWQDARVSYHSRASISDDEPATVQLASAEFGAGGAAGAASPHRPLPRDGSSGVVHYLPTALSSPEGASPRGVAGLGLRDDSTPRVGDGTGFHEREESTSGSSAEDSFMSCYDPAEHSQDAAGLDIRPYRNEQGELQWNQTTAADAQGAQQRLQPSVNRRPSQVGHAARESQAGELAFV